MPGRTAQEYLSGRFERAFERRRDLMDADRLGQVAVEPGLESPFNLFRLGVGGQGDDRNIAGGFRFL